MNSQSLPRRRPSGVGFSHLGLGLAFTADATLAYNLVAFLTHFDTYPHPGPTVIAWSLLLSSMLVAQLAMLRFGGQLSSTTTLSLMFLWAIVTLMDIAGSWGAVGNQAPPTAAASVGAGLLLLVTLRRARDILLASAVLGFLLAASLLVRPHPDPLTFGPELVTLLVAVSPGILGALMVRSLKNMVQLELDLAQAQSTITAPRYAVGMLASEQLARLDFAAEQLLENVATGRTRLPLDSDTAASASSLATELRLHLVKGRRETWLYHAISESAFLGPAVRLQDPDGLAGLLDARQRDGLLSAVWLLMYEPAKQGQSIQITLMRDEAGEQHYGRQQLRIPITIRVNGVPRSRVDPATWQAVRRVGRYVEFAEGAAFRVDINCVVDNPVDQDSDGRLTSQARGET